MTPKEKALELYQRYHVLGSDFTRGVSMHEFAKQCALIAVGEMIDEISCIRQLYDIEDSYVEYWNEVKDEIEKL